MLTLGFQVCQTNIKAQQIDSSTFKIFKMILASFQIENNLKRVWFFQQTFLLTDTSIEIILKMLFFILSNVDI